MLIKEKDTVGCDKVLNEHLTFYQFHYFFRKHKKLKTFYISRDGIISYERNNRPLTGDGIAVIHQYVNLCKIHRIEYAYGIPNGWAEASKGIREKGDIHHQA